MIMIALRIFNLYFASFQSWLLPSFRRGEWRTQRFSRLFSGRKSTGLLLNQDWGVGLNQIEKFNEIGIPHANTAVTRRFPNFVFVVGSVNVDEAIPRVRIVRFEPVKPKDSGKDQILIRRMFVPKTDRLATLENGAHGRVCPELLGNPKLAERRLHTALLRSKAEARSGNGISAHRFLTRLQREALIADGNVKTRGLHRDIWTLHFACK